MGIVSDFRIALRMLARSPGFVVVSVLSLALGIGVNVSVFSSVNALFLRPLPAVPESGRLVSIYHRTKSGSFTSSSYPDYTYYREQNHVFSGMAAYLRFPTNLRSGEQTERIYGELVSSDYFSVLGLSPALGRLIVPDEREPVAVLSHDFWQRRFGGNRGVIGQAVRLGSGLFTVVGVAPREFRGIVLDWAESPSVWLPVYTYKEALPTPPFGTVDFLHYWGNQSYELVGRLRDGVTLGQAAAEMTALAKRIQKDHPERARVWSKEMAEYGDLDAVVFPTNRMRLWPGDRSNLIDFLVLLAAVAGLVLLIACLNVASLVLARTTKRRRELAIRLSLGAGRWTIVRQLLAENLLLSLFGGAIGILVSGWTSTFLASFHQAFRLPVPPETAVDVRVLAAATGVSVVSAALLVLFPARLAFRLDVNTGLKTDMGTTSASGLRAHHALVLGQVALSVVMVVAAGLFVRTLWNAQAEDFTSQSENVLLGSLDLGSRGYDGDRGGRVYSQVLERVRTVPGVRDAALVFVVPLGGRRGGTNVVITPPDGGVKRSVQIGLNVVTPGYFQMIGIPVVRGRDFSDADRSGAPAVAMINDVMAQTLFPGREPVGQRFLLTWPPAATVEVIGVVRDGKFRNYRSEREPTVYVPLAQRFMMAMNLEVRTAGNPSALAAAINREVAAVDKDLPLNAFQTLKTHFETALARERLTAALLSALGALALVLTAIGLYGVLSYAVSQRTREIGIRMALGARSQSVVRAVLGSTMRIVTAGLGIGVAVALALSSVVRGLLYGITPTDPAVFATTILVLAGTAALASYLPARRAAKVDPMKALRYE
ncbi:MAG TPA: ABC transporter permease [Bryobacteraceae bacterium]|nr:ABC transporter permease [Bryobacteraceae bacterium]